MWGSRDWQPLAKPFPERHFALSWKAYCWLWRNRLNPFRLSFPAGEGPHLQHCWKAYFPSWGCLLPFFGKHYFVCERNRSPQKKVRSWGGFERLAMQALDKALGRRMCHPWLGGFSLALVKHIASLSGESLSWRRASLAALLGSLHSKLGEPTTPNREASH